MSPPHARGHDAKSWTSTDRSRRLSPQKIDGDSRLRRAIGTWEGPGGARRRNPWRLIFRRVPTPARPPADAATCALAGFIQLGPQLPGRRANGVALTDCRGAVRARTDRRDAKLAAREAEQAATDKKTRGKAPAPRVEGPRPADREQSYRRTRGSC